MRAVPRLCIIYPGICLTTEETHGKPQSGYLKGARLVTQRRPQLLVAVTTAGCHVGSFDEAAPAVQRTVLPSSPAVKRIRRDGGALVLSFETSGKTCPATQSPSRKT